jgi:hypothetical protein
MKKLLKILTIFLIILPIVVVGWFSYYYFAMSGEVGHEYKFDREHAFISRLFPINRVEEIECGGDCSQKLVIDPVYFRLFAPVSFERVKVEVEFEPNDQKIIELGFARDEDATRVVLAPIYNELVEDLVVSDDWDKITSDDLILFQRNRKFDSIDEFVKADSLEADSVALYNYSDSNFVNYSYDKVFSSKLDYNFDYKVKGLHQLYVYVEDELDFDFRFENFVRGDQVLVYKKGEQIYKKDVDGGEVTVHIPELADGVYKIVLNLSNDSIVSGFKTDNAWSFVHEVNLVDEKPIHLYTKSNKLFFQTMDKEGLQTIQVNRDDLEVGERIKQYKYDFGKYADAGLGFDRAFMKINSNGAISLSESSYVNPEFKDFRSFTSLDGVDVDFILAKYEPAEKVGDRYFANVDFDLAGAYYDDEKRIKFVFSLPEVNDLDDGYPEISKIKMNLKREPISFGVIWRKVKSLF